MRRRHCPKALVKDPQNMKLDSHRLGFENTVPLWAECSSPDSSHGCLFFHRLDSNLKSHLREAFPSHLCEQVLLPPCPLLSSAHSLGSDHNLK